MPGKILSSKAFVLRYDQGTATGDGVTYELSRSPSGTPMIRSKKTGKFWSIGWQDLLDMAIEAGVDNDKPEASDAA